MFDRATAVVVSRLGGWVWTCTLLAVLGLVATAPLQAQSTLPDAPPKVSLDEAAAAVAPVPGQPSGNEVLRHLALMGGTVVLLFIGSLVLGSMLARWTRLEDQGWKFTLVVFAIAASLTVTISRWPPKLGIDLSGGHTLVYEVDQSQLKEGQTVEMEKLVGAIIRRVNPAGVLEVSVRPFGQSEIEVTIPKASEEELERITNIIGQAGSLEFRILANHKDHEAIITDALEQSRQSPTKREVVRTDEEGNRKVVARWVVVAPAEQDHYRDNPRYVARVNAQNQVEVLVVMDDYNVTGEYLRSANADFDEQGGPAVSFVFDSRGERLFGELTSNNLPDPVQKFKRDLGVILDGQMHTAPSIDQAIFGRGIIHGSFTVEKTKEIAQVLTAGSLPAALVKEPSSRSSVGALLGEDTIKRGVRSMIIAMVAVVTFMLVYYRFAGVVANLAVLLNVLLTVAFMILFKAAFTLAGLAGLALTVGMAVDANVLIYERMREELARGATLRMAIRNGFERATTTIVDANVTTLITAIVLYVIGTDQIKGFAVTLTIGILMNLFTAITFSRLMFDSAERLHWLKELKMMRVLTNPNFDFIGKRYIAVAGSLILIAIGMAAVWQRGSSLLDIDFTGGVQVELLFDKAHAQDVADIRSTLEKARTDAVAASQPDPFPDATVQDVRTSGDPAGIRFNVITSNQDENKVEERLAALFAGDLAHNNVQVGSEQPIPETPATAEGATPPPANPLAGGTTLELKFDMPVPHGMLEGMVTEALPERPEGQDVAFQLSNEEFVPGLENHRRFQEWKLAISLPPADAKSVVAKVEQELTDTPFFPASNKIGATVAAKTKEQAIYAMLASMLLILGYVWLRFSQISFGFASLVALVHDVLVTLGALALSYWLAGPLGFAGIDQFKINLPVVAAFLTIIGYSLNDTIVIFDRIREIRGKSPAITADLVNQSINQTLSRTILTSLTVFIVVAILYGVGGPGIHAFAFALVVGVVAGTYSTIFIATPILIWLNPPSDAATAGRSPKQGLAKASGPR